MSERHRRDLQMNSERTLPSGRVRAWVEGGEYSTSNRNKENTREYTNIDRGKERSGLEGVRRELGKMEGFNRDKHSEGKRKETRMVNQTIEPSEDSLLGLAKCSRDPLFLNFLKVGTEMDLPSCARQDPSTSAPCPHCLYNGPLLSFELSKHRRVVDNYRTKLTEIATNMHEGSAGGGGMISSILAYIHCVGGIDNDLPGEDRDRVVREIERYVLGRREGKIRDRGESNTGNIDVQMGSGHGRDTIDDMVGNAVVPVDIGSIQLPSNSFVDMDTFSDMHNTLPRGDIPTQPHFNTPAHLSPQREYDDSGQSRHESRDIFSQGGGSVKNTEERRTKDRSSRVGGDNVRTSSSPQRISSLSIMITHIPSRPGLNDSPILEYYTNPNGIPAPPPSEAKPQRDSIPNLFTVHTLSDPHFPAPSIYPTEQQYISFGRKDNGIDNRGNNHHHLPSVLTNISSAVEGIRNRIANVSNRLNNS